MKLTNDWKTAVLESETNEENIVLVSIRDKLQQFYETGKLKYLIDIEFAYNGDSKGFPDKETSDLIEKISDPLKNIMEKDKLAICIIEAIGDNVKNWSYACRHLGAFQDRLNECLSENKYIPLQINAYEDTSWGEYQELLDIACMQDNE